MPSLSEMIAGPALQQLGGSPPVTVKLRNLAAAMRGEWTPPDCPPPPIGERPERIGDYELLEVVGVGGMATVYKARHLGLQRIVALKVIDGDFRTAGDNARRFRVETAAVAKLDHPNIVPVYETGEVDNLLFYSMALVEGGSLADEVAPGPLLPVRAAELMRPVALAIDYAHRQGVVHRDLKPGNILLDRAGRPRVTDFGIAKCADIDSDLTRAGQILGTPSFMPPEQARGLAREVGPAADVYSLGATLYCLLTGRPPFQAAVPMDTIYLVVTREPISPRQLNPAVGRDLETICLKCLEKLPDRRYASAQALADDLGRFLDRQPIRARPTSALHKAERWCRRNPLPAILSVGVAAVFLAAFALVSWSFWRADQARRDEAEQRAAADRARDEALRQGEAERWERYRATMASTVNALQLHNFAAARQSLDDAPEPHRDWEWRYFQQQLDRSRDVALRHDSPVQSVLFLGGGRLAVMGRAIGLWDVASGQRIRTLANYAQSSPARVAVSPDGRLLAYAADDRTIAVWDLIADRRRAEFAEAAGGRLNSVEFNRAGTQIVSGWADGLVRRWELATATPLPPVTVAEKPSAAVGFTHARERMLVSDLPDGTARVWDLEAGRQVAILRGHEGRIVDAKFSPQKDRVLTSEGFPDFVLRLWNAETGELLASLPGHRNVCLNAAFSPDGSRIASASHDQTARLWNGKTGALVATLRGHAGLVHRVEFSPDGRLLMTASQDQTVRLWDSGTGDPVVALGGHSGAVYDAAFSSDGGLLASASEDGTTRLWDVRQAQRNGVLSGHGSFVYGAAFLPDGRRVVSGGWDGTVRVWEATSGRETAKLPYPDKGIVTGLAVHPAGRMLATIGRDEAVRLWDLDRGQELHHWHVPTNHWQDSRVAFSTSGDLLAGAGKDGVVHVWDVASRAEVAALRGHTRVCHDIAFDPAGRWLASAGGSGDNSIRIWDLGTKETTRVLTGHTDGVLSLAVRGDGRLLASGSADGTVRIWDTRTWAPVAEMPHRTAVYGLAFNAEGTRLATAGRDGAIRFWDAATGKVVAELRGHRDYAYTVAFSPDGTRLVSGSGDFTVRVWDTLSAARRAERDQPPGH